MPAYTLRPIFDEDLSLVLMWRNAPEVRQNMFNTHLITPEEHFAYFQRIRDDASKRYLLCIDEDERPVGVVNFIDIDEVNRRAFWGFYSGDPSRRGIGRQMGFLALDLAFREMGLHKLNGEVLSTNQTSQDFHQRLGFMLEGVFREHQKTTHGFVDIHRYAILRRDWEEEWREKTRVRLGGLACTT